MRLRRAWQSGVVLCVLAVASACSTGAERTAAGHSSPLQIQAPAVAEPAEATGPRSVPASRLRPDAMPLDAADSAWVAETLASLSLRQKAAQVVMPWISGASISDDPAELRRMLRWVEGDEVGGLIVSTGRPAALAEKLNAAQAKARVPLLVASDLETGPSMRLRPGGTEMPPAMAFGAAGSEALARAAGQATGEEARAVGIHVTLGPVLDVNSNPANPIINIRSFGEDAERAGRLASAWIEGARSAGLQTVGKHFPGHGDTHVDSHLGLATVTGDSARLDAVELAPFRAAIGAGMDGVLVGHLAVRALDGPNALPASLSPRIVHTLLRERLGFERGLIFTDALNMGAVTRHYTVEEASVRALVAGADVLLQPPGTTSVIDAIVRAVESGRLPRERLDDAVRHVLLAKARAGLRQQQTVRLDSVAARIGSPAHREVAERVTAASIALVRDRGGLIPLAPGARVLLLGYSSGTSGVGTLASELSAAGVRVEQARVGSGTSAGQLRALRERAASADVVLAAVAIAPYQYRALGLDGGFGAFVESIASGGKPTIAVSLGSPYLLDSFPSIPTYLLAWSSSATAQRAVVAALLGRASITGEPPASLTAR
jgi:beta-N-acetylhexosaminidase